MHPCFGSACGDPTGDRTAEMNEIGVRTHIASRAGSVLGVFGGKNHRKSVQCRNASKFGLRGLHGHCGPWKKMIDFGGRDRETYNRGSPPPIPKPPGCTTSANAVCRNAPKFWQRVWGPARGPHDRDERNRSTNARCGTCGQCFSGFRCEKSYKIRTASERDKFWLARPAWSLLPTVKK